MSSDLDVDRLIAECASEPAVAVVPIAQQPAGPFRSVTGVSLGSSSAQPGSQHLHEASRQWASRPADQRFWTLEEMAARTREYAVNSREIATSLTRLEVIAAGDDLRMTCPSFGSAEFSHWSFGQLCVRTGAPAAYLRSLPAEHTANLLNYHLHRDFEATANVLLTGSSVRAFLSGQYSRIWNHEILERLKNAQTNGWRVPPARPAGNDDPRTRQATEADCLRDNQWSALAIKPGDWIAPAGLYASDHDCFAFMVNEDSRIDDGSEGGLSRGFFVSNSEVGAGAFKLTAFMYRHVCGNHIVWDASNVTEVRLVHRGNADQRFGRELAVELRKYATASAAEDKRLVAAAMRFEIGNSKDDVLDALFGKKIATREKLEIAFALAGYESDQCRNQFSPRSAWGMVQGLTRLSQATQFADERVELDRAAGRILALVS